VRFSPLFLEELRARTPLQELVGRRVLLRRSGRESKGCCPFHGEKTPSFYVYDDHFHCYGCGQHGDCFSFLMQSQGCDFMTAVTQLAAEAGLAVPQDQATAATRAQVATIAAFLDVAQSWFTRWLLESQGAAARTYLQDRGLSMETAAAFGLGWSGPGRGQLAAAMDAPISIMVEAGLMARREDDGVAVDSFRSRLMFPIMDETGRVISFGGRTLGDRQPKYINGPETPVYSKRRTLYGMNRARAGLQDGASLVVVEGYLDVIAMHVAGETAAVAPLGTSLTEEQLDELWRLSPAPVLCFDGDAAGGVAALHAMEQALPKLAPSRSLRVAALPAGKDPDSLIREAGADAIRAVIEDAMPLEIALYEALRSDGSSPFARAQHRNRIGAAADSIADAVVAQDIRRSMLNRYFEELAG
jgi:DNA primase